MPVAGIAAYKDHWRWREPKEGKDYYELFALGSEMHGKQAVEKGIEGILRWHAP